MAKRYLDYTGLDHLSDYIKQRLVVVYEAPASPADGDIILYMGETTNDLIHSCLYSYDAADAEWVEEFTGLKINLNGQKASDSIDIYAATSAGVAGQVLTSAGENQPPVWQNWAGYCPQLVEEFLSFSTGAIPVVQNNAIIFNI